MATVVVVHADAETRDLYAGLLRGDGHEVIACAGPQPPDFFCPVLKHCGCEDCEQGDVLVYDPCLMSQRSHPASERIIYRLREWYPEKPVIVVNCGHLSSGLIRLSTEDTGLILTTAAPDAVVEAVRSALPTTATA